MQGMIIRKKNQFEREELIVNLYQNLTLHLLSDNGLVKLQNLLAKTPFKRGKGHEKENLNRLINVYQIWGHNLYPRLKFKSIIERTEKLCSEKRLRIAYMTWKEANRFKRRYETDEYNESGIIRNNEESINLDNDNDNSNSSMEIDILKPFPMAATHNSTTTSSQSIPTYNSFNNNNNNNNNFASASTSMSASSSTSLPTTSLPTTNTSFESASTSNPNPNSNNNIPLSRLPHPLTEDERAFLRANRERALKKLREKKEALKRQQELQAQQKEQQDPPSIS
ncbi:replication fork protection component Swi3-domain-containing protein [Neocallimastix lanati (nom. inval.)]|nr:replication fork protection component Swi3-domain-containing protein [Neocallimastix sp. JGI-2020a]